MKINVLEYLKETAYAMTGKVALIDKTQEITFGTTRVGIPQTKTSKNTKIQNPYKSYSKTRTKSQYKI